MDNLQARGQRFSNTSNTVAGGSATVTEAGSSGRVHYITEIGASSANSSTAQIRVFTVGGSNIWQEVIGAAVTVGSYEKVFRVPLAGASAGSAMTVEVKTSGAGSTTVNMAGYTI